MFNYNLNLLFLSCGAGSCPMHWFSIVALESTPEVSDLNIKYLLYPTICLPRICVWLSWVPPTQLQFSHGSRSFTGLQSRNWLGLWSLVISNLNWGRFCIQTYSQGYWQAPDLHWFTIDITSLSNGPFHRATHRVATGFPQSEGSERKWERDGTQNGSPSLLVI